MLAHLFFRHSSLIRSTSAVILFMKFSVETTDVEYIFDLRCTHRKNQTSSDLESAVSGELVHSSYPTDSTLSV